MSDLQPSHRLQSLSVRNFKCFDRLALNFASQSALPGAWTCIAGINGAGKSSVLQAIALLLVKQSGALELGQSRVASFSQHPADGFQILASVQTPSQEFPRQEAFDSEAGWVKDEGLSAQHLIVGYGASRNLASRLDSSFFSISQRTRRVLSLFEPYAPLTSTEIFFRSGRETPPNFFPLLSSALNHLLAGQLPAEIEADSLRFHMPSGTVTADQLPDGYRSTIAWLSDLLWNWTQEHPSSQTTQDVDALVLIDEIDLHLHPQLQRVLVPRLRELFPRVQWFVTTHSPLVLSCFDRRELILLDSSQPSGLAPVDQQLFGLTVDQVMGHLMGVNPTGSALESPLRLTAADDDAYRELVTQIQSPAGKDPLLSPAKVEELLAKFKA